MDSPSTDRVNRLARLLRGRPSTTQSAVALWVKSLVSVLLFFSVFMVALPSGPHYLLPVAVPIPPLLAIWGAGALFAVGIALWLACADAFSRRGKGTPAPTDAPRHLVTDGLHGLIRNPLIAVEVMVIWGEALYFGSVGFFAYAALFTGFAHWVVVRLEEPELRERFGGTYEAYFRDVPRWLPRIRRPTQEVQ